MPRKRGKTSNADFCFEKGLLIFGSRSLTNRKEVEAEIEKFWEENGRWRFIVTAADPGGVCEWARLWAKTSQKGLILVAVGVDYHRGAGMHEDRSEKAMALSSHMLAIWDGSSTGTAGEIALARRLGLPTTIVQLKAPPVPAPEFRQPPVPFPF